MKTRNKMTKQDQAKQCNSVLPASTPVAFFNRLTDNPHNTSCFSVKGIVVGIIIVSLIIIG